MLKNVINLGEMPSCASDLAAAFNIISDGEAAGTFGYGRAVVSGEGQDAKLAFSSVLILRSGELRLENAQGEKLSIDGEQAISLPAGLYQWQAENADCIILTFNTDNPEVSFSVIDLDHPMSAGGAPNPALLTTSAPETTRYEFQDSEALSWGVWATTPYARHPITYSFAEMMMIRKGEVVLSNSDEGSDKFVAGDIFLVLPGAVAAWENPTDLQKFWVIRSGE